MGAIRAREMAHLGMRGFGRVFERFVAEDDFQDDEVALLVVHGLLHLLGLDHEIEAEAERMEAIEQQLLSRFYRVSRGA